MTARQRTVLIGGLAVYVGLVSYWAYRSSCEVDTCCWWPKLAGECIAPLAWR